MAVDGKELEGLNETVVTGEELELGTLVTVVIVGAGAVKLLENEEDEDGTAASPASINSCSVKTIGVSEPSHALYLMAAVSLSCSTGQVKWIHRATDSSQPTFPQRHLLVRLQPEAAKFC